MEIYANFKGAVGQKELWEFYKLADKDVNGRVRLFFVGSKNQAQCPSHHR